MNAQQLNAAAARVSRSRILFAHQSVGANIIDGLKAIEPEIGAAIPVSPFDPTRPWAGIASARLGNNGDPRSKTEAFVAAVAQSSPALALQKYCYVDLRSKADATELFDFYRGRVGALSQAGSSACVLHVTMPLRTVPQGLKARLARLLGRGRDHAAENAARETFNDLMRRSFEPDTIFDLADQESSSARPRSLRSDLTTDGGHLNERGRRQLAAVFLEFLARHVP